MQEVFTYPWMTDRCMEAILPDQDGILQLSTPPAPTESYIRSSLLPNLCKAVGENERYFHEFSIFEEAQVFFDRDYTSPYDKTEALPYQPRHIAGAVVGDASDVTALFRKAKGILENMSRFTHMEALSFRQEEKPYWSDNTVWMNLFRGEERIGDFGLLKKKAAMDCGIKEVAVMLFEFNFDACVPFKSRTNSFTHLTEYPMNNYDVSLLFDKDTKWEAIRETVLKKKNADSFLQDVEFVDEYRGKQIPAGKKSVTLRLIIGSKDKTLTSEEIEACAKTVTKFVAKNLGAEARF